MKSLNEQLIEASLDDNLNKVKLLIEQGADVNAQNKHGNTALIYAAWLGYIDIVKLLIEKGADVNVIDKNGRTALMYASQSKSSRVHTDIVELLEQHRAVS